MVYPTRLIHDAALRRFFRHIRTIGRAVRSPDRLITYMAYPGNCWVILLHLVQPNSVRLKEGRSARFSSYARSCFHGGAQPPRVRVYETPSCASEGYGNCFVSTACGPPTTIRGCGRCTRFGMELPPEICAGGGSVDKCMGGSRKFFPAAPSPCRLSIRTEKRISEITRSSRCPGK